MRNQAKGIKKLGRAWMALADRLEGERSGCLQSDEICDAVQGKLTPEQVRPMADHLAGCPACSEAWHLARLLARDSEVCYTPRPHRSRLAGWPAWAAAAAAAVILMAGLGIQQLTSPSDPEAVFRRVGTVQIHSRLSEEEALARHAFVLKWTRPDTQERVKYQLTVTTQTLDVIAEAADLEEPLYHVPQERLSDLPAGTLLHWQVKAASEDGSRYDSPTFLTRLK